MAIRPLAPDIDTELRAARALGRAEAAELEARLRASELADRERLREEWAAGAAGRQQGRTAARHDLTWKRLRREEAELIAYRDAILASRPWRAAELLRGLVGRSWTPRTPAEPSPVRPVEPGSPPDPASELARLEASVQELSSFLAAIRRSRTWRTIQSMRRLVGREW